MLFSTLHMPSLIRNFFKYTDFHAKECKLYNKLLDKISSEIELSVLSPSEKDKPAPVPIPVIIQDSRV